MPNVSKPAIKGAKQSKKRPAAKVVRARRAKSEDDMWGPAMPVPTRKQAARARKQERTRAMNKVMPNRPKAGTTKSPGWAGGKKTI